MIRNPSIRRLIVALLLLMGPLTQFQTLYACELMEHEHDRPSMVCCCDEPGIMGSDIDGAYQGQAAVMDNGCCAVSYEPSQVDQASGSSTQFQQVLLLTAAQPPPLLLVLFDFPEIIPVNHGVHFEPHSSSPLPYKPVYLLTSRFRI
ncbi:MAG: hypothetical protein GXP14_02260 [Gammaproteobacteria bacterium]|nr:hypothetical protein [Gammaproteobacteria bacterium]